MQKNKREDFRVEDELRAAKAKYEESSEDVLRRMQDIKEAEAEAINDLTNFLDAELDYHERCVEELRRTRQEWAAGQGHSHGGSRSDLSLSRRQTRSRSNTARSYSERSDRTERRPAHQDVYEEEEPMPEPVRVPIRSGRFGNSGASTPDTTARPGISRSSTYGSAQSGTSYREPPPLPPDSGLASSRASKTPLPPPTNISSLRGNLRPVSRVSTNQSASSADVFADGGYDTTGSSNSPDYERSESPATSYGSLSRTASNSALSASPAPVGPGVGARKAPPPPPSRAKKPPPPIPAKRDIAY